MKLKQHWQFIAYGVCAIALLVMLNVALWPTPDEYFYSTIVRSYQAAQQGMVAWADINTEHLGFIPWLVYVYTNLVQPVGFIAQRLPMIAFPLGVVLLLYVYPKYVGLNENQRMWLLWPLLLITGFWMFGARIMLDAPSAFAIGLLVLLLLRKAPRWQVGLALAMVLLVKEYYWFLMLPIVFGTALVDRLQTNLHWSIKLRQLVGDTLILIPTMVVVITYLDINWLPYPRLLLASLESIFGDLFTVTHKAILTLVGVTVDVSQQVAHTVTTQTPTDMAGAHFVSEAANIKVSGSLPQGIIDAQHPYAHNTVLTKLWLIYSANFSENDLSVFIWPFALVGLGASIHRLWQGFKQQYAAVRSDLIFILLFGVFIYFNYHQADFAHGFRITLPITLALVFFCARAMQVLWNQPKQWVVYLLSALVALSLAGYWFMQQGVAYGSTLSSVGFIQAVLAYKPLIYVGVFAGVYALFVWLVYHPKWKPRSLVLIVMVIGLFILKFGPVGIEWVERSRKYDYDFGSSQATTTLHQMMSEHPKARMFGNMHPYRAQYYTADPVITNDLITPGIRKFSVIYPKRYFGGAISDETVSYLQTSQIRYVFLSYDTSTSADYGRFQDIINQHPGEFNLISEGKKGDVVQWQLFEYLQAPLTPQ